MMEERGQIEEVEGRIGRRKKRREDHATTRSGGRSVPLLASSRDYTPATTLTTPTPMFPRSPSSSRRSSTPGGLRLEKVVPRRSRVPTDRLGDDALDAGRGTRVEGRAREGVRVEFGVCRKRKREGGEGGGGGGVGGGSK